METTNTLASRMNLTRPSIADTLQQLRMEFSNIRSELKYTKSENDRLRGELAKYHSQYSALPELEIPKLRRRVTFYCHPDRGGDGELMCRLNALFDFLTSVESERKDFLNENKERCAS